jgi:RHS repeat-associated protein
VAVVQENHPDPWGLTLPLDVPPIGTGSAPLERYKFTGKEELAETGYIDFGARQYDPQRGQFTTVDPLAELARRFSPFVYANNNPLVFTDPDGMASRKIKDFNGNEHEIGDNDVTNIYNDGDAASEPQDGNGEGDEKKGGTVRQHDISPIRIGQNFYKRQEDGNYKMEINGVKPDYTLEETYIGGKVLGPILGVIWGRAMRLFGRGAVRESIAAIGAISGKKYTSAQIAGLFEGNADDVYKLIYRGISGTNNKSIIWLTLEEEYAKTYAKYGLEIYKVPANNFEYMVQEGLIKLITKNGQNIANPTITGSEYLISNPVVLENFLKTLITKIP